MMVGQSGANKRTEERASESAGDNAPSDRDGTHDAAPEASVSISPMTRRRPSTVAGAQPERRKAPCAAIPATAYFWRLRVTFASTTPLTLPYGPTSQKI